MVMGLLILLLPIATYLATFQVARRMRPLLSRLYRIVAGLIVFGGGVTSLYFAAYTGDQGGIAAFYFQLLVCSVYIFFAFLLITVNWFLARNDRTER